MTVATAEIEYNPTIRFPEGASIVKLDIKRGRRISSIPSHVKQLNVGTSKPLFTAEVVKDLTHLYVDDIVEGMSFPETLEHLFIMSYSGAKPLPTVRNIYVNVCQTAFLNKMASVPEHYIFTMNGQFSTSTIREGPFVVSDNQTIEAFGETFGVRKRTPKAAAVTQTPEPIAPPSNLTPTMLNELIKKNTERVQQRAIDIAIVVIAELEVAADSGNLSNYGKVIECPSANDRAAIKCILDQRLPCLNVMNYGNCISIRMRSD